MDGVWSECTAGGFFDVKGRMFFPSEEEAPPEEARELLGFKADRKGVQAVWIQV